jgi:hypothetical protein
MQLVEVYFDGLVGVSPVLRGTQGTDEGLFVAFGIEADEVDLLALVSFPGALNVFNDVAGNLLFHNDKDLYLKST